MQPRNGERICRRYAAHLAANITTTAFSRGYILTPLRGWELVCARELAELQADVLVGRIDESRPFIGRDSRRGFAGRFENARPRE